MNSKIFMHDSLWALFMYFYTSIHALLELWVHRSCNSTRGKSGRWYMGHCPATEVTHLGLNQPPVFSSAVLLSAMKKSCTPRTALALAWWPSSELFAYMCMCRVLLQLLGSSRRNTVCAIITMAFVRLLLLQPATVYQESHFYKGEGQDFFAFLFYPKKNLCLNPLQCMI